MVFKNIVQTSVLAEQDWLRFQAEIHGLGGRHQTQRLLRDWAAEQGEQGRIHEASVVDGGGWGKWS